MIYSIFIAFMLVLGHVNELWSAVARDKYGRLPDLRKSGRVHRIMQGTVVVREQIYYFVLYNIC